MVREVELVERVVEEVKMVKEEEVKEDCVVTGEVQP